MVNFKEKIILDTYQKPPKKLYNEKPSCEFRFENIKLVWEIIVILADWNILLCGYRINDHCSLNKSKDNTDSWDHFPLCHDVAADRLAGAVHQGRTAAEDR